MTFEEWWGKYSKDFDLWYKGRSENMMKDAYEAGSKHGHKVGSDDGWKIGYKKGYDDGYDAGYHQYTIDRPRRVEI